VEVASFALCQEDACTLRGLVARKLDAQPVSGTDIARGGDILNKRVIRACAEAGLLGARSERHTVIHFLPDSTHPQHENVGEVESADKKGTIAGGVA
jgi:hypothetical protein